MSYAIGTPNFNLPQTQGNDKRDWADTNQAFADIDAAIKTAGDDSTLALSAAQTAQTSADGAVTDAASAVSTANAAASQAATASELASLARTEAQSAVTTAGQAQTTAQAAQTTASNADTVALAAQGNIGTMSNLNTQDKTSLVAAINEVLSQIGGAMPELDFDNTVDISSATGSGYTTTKAGAIILMRNSTQGATVLCDGLKVGETGSSMSTAPVYGIPSGTVITVSASGVPAGTISFVPYKTN